MTTKFENKLEELHNQKYINRQTKIGAAERLGWCERGFKEKPFGKIGRRLKKVRKHMTRQLGVGCQCGKDRRWEKIQRD